MMSFGSPFISTFTEISQLFTVICCSIVAAGSSYARGVDHILGELPHVLQNPGVEKLQKLSLAFIILQPLALGFTKASIVFFYRRIFCGRTFDYVSHTLIAMIGAWSLGMFLASLLQCGDTLSQFWTTTSKVTSCHALPISGAFITLDVILDMCIIVLPIPFVLRLQMTLRSRVVACIVFVISGASVTPRSLLDLLHELTASPARYPWPWLAWRSSRMPNRKVC